MGQWIAVGNGFIEADHIRVRLGVFTRRGPRGARVNPIYLGSRLVIGEVESDEDGWVTLIVISDEILEQATVRKIAPLKPGQRIKRKRETIERGQPERRPWEDESARAIVVSRYLNDRKPVSSASKDTGES